MGKVLASDNQLPISGLRISQAFSGGPLTRFLKVSLTLWLTMWLTSEQVDIAR
jgi:hypothetical protein